MTKRVLMKENRILLSKAGYDAFETMPDDQKVFDSNWNFTGTIFANGYYIDPSRPRAPYNDVTDSADAHLIYLARPFVPREALVCLTPIQWSGQGSVVYPDENNNLVGKTAVVMPAIFLAANDPDNYRSWNFDGTTIVSPREPTKLYDSKGREVGVGYRRMNFKYTVFAI